MILKLFEFILIFVVGVLYGKYGKKERFEIHKTKIKRCTVCRKIVKILPSGFCDPIEASGFGDNEEVACSYDCRRAYDFLEFPE